MSQLVYQYPVVFQTNGDCSEFTISFPEDESDEFIEEYRQALRENGFPVHYPIIQQPKSIVFSVLAMNG